MRRIAAIFASVLTVGAYVTGAGAQDDATASRNASRKGIAAGDLRSDFLAIQKSHGQRLETPDARVASQGTDQSSRVTQESNGLKSQADAKREIQGVMRIQTNSAFEDVLRSGTKVDVNNFR